MTGARLTFNRIRRFCQRRVVDLVLAPAPPPAELCLRGQFDYYGDFFSVLFEGVEYVDMPGLITVTDLLYTDSVSSLPALVNKWSYLNSAYSGPALAILSADSWATAQPDQVAVVVANDIAFKAGKGWSWLGLLL